MSVITRTLPAWMIVAVALVGCSSATAQEEKRGTRIGVLDMRVAFGKYEKSIKYHEALQRLRKRFGEEQKEKEEELKALGEEIGELKEGSDVRMEKIVELRNMELDLKYWIEEQGQTLRKKLIEYTDEVEADVRKAARQVAVAKGLDLVINYYSEEEDQEIPPEEKRIPVVLYASAEVDITEAVLEILNRPAEAPKEEPKK